METIDLEIKAEQYKRLIEETKNLTITAENRGYWKYRLAEMEKVMMLIDLNLSLRSACSMVLEKTI